MTLEQALAEINKFWTGTEPLPFGKFNHDDQPDRLHAEFGIVIPGMVQEYIRHFAPAQDCYFDTVGNPMRVYGVGNLKYKQDGYNYNPVTKAPIEDWERSFFIFADEGADPVVIDLHEVEGGVQKLVHGRGSWDHGAFIAGEFGQFLLCAAAQHHALNSFEDDPIVDDEHGFNLADSAAKWYFKNMKIWAGDYYDEWCSVFDNC